MIRLVLIGVGWVVCVVCVVLVFRGIGILNEQWDRELELRMRKEGV